MLQFFPMFPTVPRQDCVSLVKEFFIISTEKPELRRQDDETDVKWMQTRRSFDFIIHRSSESVVFLPLDIMYMYCISPYFPFFPFNLSSESGWRM